MKVSKVTGYLLCGMILAAGILFFVGNNALAEDVTITTYYPAPYGVYSILRLEPRSTPPSPSEGDMYVDSGTHRIRCYLNGWKQLDN